LTTPLAVTGANQADFTVTSQPATTVAASGGTTTFTVRFTPAEAGARTAALSIVHDNSDESPFEFDLAGEGLSPSFSGITVPGTGTGVEATASVSGASCGFTSAGFAALSSIAEEPPENLQFNNGLFAFELSNCDPGGTASVSIDYGSVLPAGLEYWKYGPTAENTDPHWYRLPAVVAGSTVTFEVVDGGPGDQDLTANGTITDPGGPAEFFIEPVPVLSPAFLAIVTGLLALLAMLALSRNGLLGRVTPRSR
ncbi:MAG TPA: choice-of-anchor U domain-containing protein, partial [Pseudohaliea sp.]|nr:choice-of-anchor U domain-containing protein [Pseudohaliea sp.]